MEFRENFTPRKGPTQVYPWMGWLYLVVGAFIVGLLVLMYLDLSNLDQRKGLNLTDIPVEQAAPSNPGN